MAAVFVPETSTLRESEIVRGVGVPIDFDKRASIQFFRLMWISGQKRLPLVLI